MEGAAGTGMGGAVRGEGGGMVGNGHSIHEPERDMSTQRGPSTATRYADGIWAKLGAVTQMSNSKVSTTLF